MSTYGSVLIAPTRRRRARPAVGWLVLGGAVIVILVLLAVAQLVLPRLAEDHLRSQLSRHGQVLSVSISAFPAIELLWGDADSVTVAMRSYTDAPAGSGAAPPSSGPPATAGAGSGLQRLADFLARTAHTDSLHASAGWMRAGHLLLYNVVLTKSNGQLSASGDITNGAVRAALPRPFTLRPLSSPAGELLFRGGVHVAGLHTSLVARLRARHGALVVQPDLLGLFPSFLSLTVFRDPRVYVESVGSRRSGGGWQISAQARLSGG